jgi:hypothetical protein
MGGSPSQGLNELEGLASAHRGIFGAGQAGSTTMQGSGPTHPKETRMRFYTQAHRFYCGVDLHTRTLLLCVLDASKSNVSVFREPAARARDNTPMLALQAPVGCRSLLRGAREDSRSRSLRKN